MLLMVVCDGQNTHHVRCSGQGPVTNSGAHTAGDLPAVPPEPPVPAIGNALRRAASSSLGSQSPETGPSAAASPVLKGRHADSQASAPSSSVAPAAQLPPPALSSPLALSPQRVPSTDGSGPAQHQVRQPVVTLRWQMFCRCGAVRMQCTATKSHKPAPVR